MRTLYYKTTIFLTAGLLVAMGGLAQAFPASATSTGNSCSACHTNTQSGTMDVTGEDGTIDLDAFRNDGKTRGSLKFFSVLAGSDVDLSALVMAATDGASDYGVQIKRLEKAAILGPADTDFLVWSEAAGNSPEWTEQTSGGSPPYFTSTEGPFSGYPFASDTTHTFGLYVDAATPANWYDLEFAVPRNGARYEDQHFYLEVNEIPEPASLVLFGFGCFALTYGIWRRRRRDS